MISAKFEQLQTLIEEKLSLEKQEKIYTPEYEENTKKLNVFLNTLSQSDIKALKLDGNQEYDNCKYLINSIKNSF